MRILGALAVTLLLGGSPLAGHAADKLRLGQVKCPPIIADTTDGIWHRERKGKSPFKCFESPRAANRAGFEQPLSLAQANFSAWWRLSVAQTRSTCPGPVTPGIVTIFVQTRAHAGSLLAQVCPVTRVYRGVALADGFLLSSTEQYVSGGADDPCAGGPREVTHFVHVENLRTSSSGKAHYRVVELCKDAPAAFSCISEWSGTIQRETHAMWPAVPEDPNEFNASCSAALQTCAGCHF